MATRVQGEDGCTYLLALTFHRLMTSVYLLAKSLPNVHTAAADESLRERGPGWDHGVGLSTLMAPCEFPDPGLRKPIWTPVGLHVQHPTLLEPHAPGCNPRRTHRPSQASDGTQLRTEQMGGEGTNRGEGTEEWVMPPRGFRSCVL